MQASLFDRKNFASLEECVYLNQASLGLISETTNSAMHTFLDNTARHGNLNMSDKDEVSFFSDLRQQGAKLLDCDESRLAIISSAGEMLSQLPYLFSPLQGQEIIAVATDFPALTRPWLLHASKNNSRIVFVDDLPELDLTTAIIEKINKQTAVIAVSHVQFSTGTVLDIPTLKEAASKVNARLIVDITQSAGAMAINSQSWDADVLVCSGYKWLGGHGGVALAVMSPKLLDDYPVSPGWMGAPDPFDFDATSLSLACDARRYTQSTMSYVSLTGLSVSISERLALSNLAVEQHAHDLAGLLIKQAGKSGWQPFRPVTSSNAANHIVTLSHGQKQSKTVFEHLRNAGIICGSRNNRLRISIAPYNDASDIEALANALIEIQ